MMETTLIIAGVLASIVAAWLDGRARGRRESRATYERGFNDACMVDSMLRRESAQYAAETRQLERLPDATRPC